MKQALSFFSLGCLAFCSFIFLNGCKKDKDDGDETSPVNRPDIVFYALTADNKLVKYNAKSPETPVSSVSITGMESGDNLLAIDFRPATGQLYGLAKSSRLYVINPETGKALMKGAGPFSPVVSGDLVGFDFNPVVDRIRIVTNAGQNLRLDPETGLVATDKNLNPGSPTVSAVAYTNSYAGASSTNLFDIDLASQKLVKQSPPNEGTITEIGPLKITWASEENGFDISPDNKVALASLSVNGENGLYQIDTATGKATKLGVLGTPVIGLAIPSSPVAYATDESNNLYIFNFDAATPAIIKPITGLKNNEKIRGLDMRPATGQLYALGSTYRLYTINIGTGTATAVGSSAFALLMTGSSFGFDFNPVTDQIRLISNTGENLRLNPSTGAVDGYDTNLNPFLATIASAAYTNNYVGATTTTLFDINWNNDKLYRHDPPNSGTLTEIGPLGIDIEGTNGFDIAGTSGNAYAILTVDGATKLYSIDLTNGSATAVADFPVVATGFTIGLGF